MEESVEGKKVIIISVIALAIITIIIGIFAMQPSKESERKNEIIAKRESKLEADNSRFTKYEADSVPGITVKALCQETVNYINNKLGTTIRIGLSDKQREDSEFDQNDPDNLVTEDGKYGEKYKKIKNDTQYSIKCYYNSEGHVRSIIVKKIKK